MICSLAWFASVVLVVTTIWELGSVLYLVFLLVVCANGVLKNSILA